jgi:hypothetical protein
MAKLIATRGSQYPLVASFAANFGDTMVATDGVEKALFTTGGVFDVIHLPQNSVVVGGELIVDVVSTDTGTATVSVGDVTLATRHLTTTNLKAAARTALGLTGFLNDIGRDIRITIANAEGDAGAGNFRLNVLYIIKDRINEVQTH